ncbi:hypothetical protein ABTD85_23425, partial [Acinetobacter baumannii]
MNGANALHPSGFIAGWERGDVRPEPMNAIRRAPSGDAAQPCISVPVAADSETSVQQSSLLKPPPSALRA